MLKRLSIVLVLLVVVAAGYFVYAIGPSNIIGMIRYDQRREGDLEVGDPVPDLALVGLDGEGRVHLHDYVGGRPLVLIFGSFT